MGLRLRFNSSEPFTGEMLSGLIQSILPLNFTAGELSAQLPAFLGTLNLNQFPCFRATLSSHFLDVLRRDWPDFQADWRPIALCVYFGLVVTIGLTFRSHCSDEARKGHQSHDSTPPRAEDSPASGYTNDTYGDEIAPASDAQLAEELQLEEALIASKLSSAPSKSAPSSSILKRSWCFRKSPKTLCEICFEMKKEHKMFINPTCSHSFCIDCTSRHIAAKIQENIKAIRCPEVDCNAALDYTSCREVISKDIIVKWDECLCKSMFPESQIVYCPFSDCSAMLVKDPGAIIKRINCPACHRNICGTCCVPWHTEFTCEEYMKLSEKKKGREELLLKELAKKKSWRQCPRCKYYVEKTEGCIHITCRCKYEFCYRCGSKWRGTHGPCNYAV